MGPIIEKQEFVRRWQRVQQMMEEEGLDLVAAYADDRFVYGQAYARWLVNYQPQFEAVLILIPSKGEPIAVTGAESVEFVYGSSHCGKVFAVQEFLHPDEEYPYCDVTSMKAVLTQIEVETERKIQKIGLAGCSLIPYPMMKMLQELVGAERLIDVDQPLTMLRAVKSENELEVIRYAYQIAEMGMHVIFRETKAGRTEREIAAEAEYTMRKMGSEGMGIETMVASGPANTSPILSRTTQRKLETGDLVVSTLAPRYEGYHGAVARPFVLGGASGEMEKRIDLLRRSQELTAEVLRPGMPAYKADEMARKLLKEAGFGSHFTYTGIHSTGVIEFEAPILSSDNKMILQENMVFSIDIPLFLNEWGGMRLENGYLITGDGAKPLNSLELTY